MHNFFSGFFQHGYVTRDLDAACAAFCRKFGPTDFLVTSPEPINGVPAPTRRIALAWIDEVMTEIIEPDPAQTTIYDHAIPDTDGPIRLHHLGILVDSYASTMQRLAELGYAVPMAGSMPGAIDYIYADTRDDLGVFSEFICLYDEGRKFFDAVPRTRTR